MIDMTYAPSWKRELYFIEQALVAHAKDCGLVKIKEGRLWGTGNSAIIKDVTAILLGASTWDLNGKDGAVQQFVKILYKDNPTDVVLEFNNVEMIKSL